jgi:quercetin dioxygenase-like cupin family protein
MRAFKLINTPDNKSAFQKGSIPVLEHINATHFFAQTTIDVQNALHPAPRYQFVITLKGKLKFTVSSGDSFVIEPGIILVAKDTEGEGHKWEIVDGNEWHRIYIVPHASAEDHFIAD